MHDNQRYHLKQGGAVDSPIDIDRFGVQTRAGGPSVRKIKEGEITADLFGFLTTEPKAEVFTKHPSAMPVILTTEEEREV